jgi:transcriptional regulator with XRE-family HTH domain
MIHNNIKSLRKYIKMTQQEFAAPLGMAGNTLSDIETGKSEVTELLLIGICTVHKANRTYLETGEGYMLQVAPEGSETKSTPANTPIPSKADMIIAESLARYQIGALSVIEVERIRKMLDMLLEILVSNSEETKNSIESNLFTFQHTVRSEKDNLRKDMEIATLKEMNAELMERIERLEKKLDPPRVQTTKRKKA